MHSLSGYLKLFRRFLGVLYNYFLSLEYLVKSTNNFYREILSSEMSPILHENSLPRPLKGSIYQGV